MDCTLVGVERTRIDEVKHLMRANGFEAASNRMLSLESTVRATLSAFPCGTKREDPCSISSQIVSWRQHGKRPHTGVRPAQTHSLRQKPTSVRDGRQLEIELDYEDAKVTRRLEQGMGLPIAKAIVGAHGGTIGVGAALPGTLRIAEVDFHLRVYREALVSGHLMLGPTSTSAAGSRGV
jgi:hypothetical protein